MILNVSTDLTGRMNLFFAIILMKSRNTATLEELFSEEFHLIRAISLENAHEIALGIAKEQETIYQNSDGETLIQEVWKILDVQSVLYDDTASGPLYVRHFRNRSAYEEFEPLLNGNI